MENTAVKKKKAPIASIIFTVLAILGVFSSFGISIVPTILPNYGLPEQVAYTPRLVISAILASVQMIGMIIFLVGLFLHRKNGNILCGVGIALNFIPIAKDLFSKGTAVSLSSNLVIAIFLLIAAVFYFTRIKVLGSPLKLIFGLLAIIFAFVFAGNSTLNITKFFAEVLGCTADLEGLWYAFTHVHSIVFNTAASFAAAFTSLWFYLAIILFTPKKG